MLSQPWFTPAIVLLWLASMGWLVTSKIMPTLAGDAPPGCQALYATANKLVPVAWSVQWNDAPVGYSVSRAERLADASLVVDNVLHFDVIPLDEMIPAWLRPMIQGDLAGHGRLPFDAHGSVVIDGRGRLQSFGSTVMLPGTSDGIVLAGTVQGNRVSIMASAHGMRYDIDRHLPEGMVLGDELSPQATLPGLAVGRRWTVPTFSPLRPAGAPIEVLHAHVTGERSFFWDDHLVRVHEVCYRTDPTAPHHEPRFTMFVDMNGRVLKQDSVLLGARLTFIRRSDADAAQLAAAIDARANDDKTDAPDEPDTPGTATTADEATS